MTGQDVQVEKRKSGGLVGGRKPERLVLDEETDEHLGIQVHNIYPADLWERGDRMDILKRMHDGEDYVLAQFRERCCGGRRKINMPTGSFIVNYADGMHTSSLYHLVGGHLERIACVFNEKEDEWQETNTIMPQEKELVAQKAGIVAEL